ncbi:MAG TPA: hypothetical protein PLZ62_04150 [bacterium]|nr:hypothetical protein [bacterium]
MPYSFFPILAALEDNIKTPFSGDTTIIDIIGNVINYAFIIVGILSVFFIIIGGFQYVVSGGNDEKTKKAVSTITYAVVGLIIVFVSYAIIELVKKAISYS